MTMILEIRQHRRAMRLGLLVAIALLVWTAPIASAGTAESPASSKQMKPEEKSVQVQYLEIVTPDVEKTCAALAKVHNVSFSAPEPMLGNARVAALNGGGRISVRAPMREDEAPVVRPYMLVDDIEAAIRAATEAGAEFAMLATEIPGQGTFAIYFLGGIQYGLWQD